MEAIGLIIGVILLVWICSSSSSSKATSKYEIRNTSDERYSEVINTQTGETEYVGTIDKCEQWISSHE